MNCDEVEELLVEYLLRELSDESRGAIDSHLRQGCASCLALEKQLAEGIEILLDSLPSEDLSLQQREKILAHATDLRPKMQVALNRTRETTDFRPGNAGPGSLASRILSSLIALAAGILLMMAVAPIDSRSKLAENGASENRIHQSDTRTFDPNQITRETELADEKHAKPRLVSMQRTNVASMIEGHILWDSLSHEVHFFGNGVPTPPVGMRYVLWLIGDQNQTLASKELRVSADGLCKATASATMSDIIRISITLESTVSRFERPSKNVELTLDTKRLNTRAL